jgi:hypothetical protein
MRLQSSEGYTKAIDTELIEVPWKVYDGQQIRSFMNNRYTDIWGTELSSAGLGGRPFGVSAGNGLCVMRKRNYAWAEAQTYRQKSLTVAILLDESCDG